MRQTTVCNARGQEQAVVESQPAVETAVSGDPHEEEFDFGHHVALVVVVRLFVIWGGPYNVVVIIVFGFGFVFVSRYE